MTTTSVSTTTTSSETTTTSVTATTTSATATTTSATTTTSVTETATSTSVTETTTVIPCSPSPCVNSGTCVVDGGETAGYRCDCTYGYGGVHCDTFCVVDVDSAATETQEDDYSSYPTLFGSLISWRDECANTFATSYCAPDQDITDYQYTIEEVQSPEWYTNTFVSFSAGVSSAGGIGGGCADLAVSVGGPSLTTLPFQRRQGMTAAVNIKALDGSDTTELAIQVLACFKANEADCADSDYAFHGLMAFNRGDSTTDYVEYEFTFTQAGEWWYKMKVTVGSYDWSAW